MAEETIYGRIIGKKIFIAPAIGFPPVEVSKISRDTLKLFGYKKILTEKDESISVLFEYEVNQNDQIFIRCSDDKLSLSVDPFYGFNILLFKSIQYILKISIINEEYKEYWENYKKN